MVKKFAKWFKKNKRIVPHYTMSKNTIPLIIAIFPHIVACTIISIFFPHQIIGIFFFGLFFPDIFGFIHLHTVHHKKRENNFHHFMRSMSTKKISHICLLILSVIFLLMHHYAYFFAGISHLILDYAGL